MLLIYRALHFFSVMTFQTTSEICLKPNLTFRFLMNDWNRGPYLVYYKDRINLWVFINKRQQPSKTPLLCSKSNKPKHAKFYTQKLKIKLELNYFRVF